MWWIVEMAEWRYAFASDWRMLFFCSLVFFLLAVFAFGDGCGSIAYFLETLLNVLDIGLLGIENHCYGLAVKRCFDGLDSLFETQVLI